MPEFDVVRQRNDIILKRIASAMHGDLLRRFGLSFPDIVGGMWMRNGLKRSWRY